MKQRAVMSVCIVFACVLTLLRGSSATETSSGELSIYLTRIKAVQDDFTPPELITLPTCPTQVVAFSPTTIHCPDTGACTIAATVTSEISDITAGFDSIRFFLTIDGAATGVLPSTNFGVQSTAKTGQIESATAAWMKRDVAPGVHTVEVRFCVADTSPGGGATAFAGDRILRVETYKGR